MRRWGLEKANATHTLRMLRSLVELDPNCPMWKVEYGRGMIELEDGDGDGDGEEEGRELITEGEEMYITEVNSKQMPTENTKRFVPAGSGGERPLKIGAFATKPTNMLQGFLTTAERGSVDVDVIGISWGEEDDESSRVGDRRLAGFLEYVKGQSGDQLILIVGNADEGSVILSRNLEGFAERLSELPRGQISTLPGVEDILVGRASELKSLLEEMIRWAGLYGNDWGDILSCIGRRGMHSFQSSLKSDVNIVYDGTGELFYHTDGRVRVFAADLNLDKGFFLTSKEGDTKEVFVAVVPELFTQDEGKEETEINANASLEAGALEGLRQLDAWTVAGGTEDVGDNDNDAIFLLAERSYKMILLACSNYANGNGYENNPTKTFISENFFLIFLNLGKELTKRGEYSRATKLFFYGLMGGKNCDIYFYGEDPDARDTERKTKNEYVFYHSYTAMFLGEASPFALKKPGEPEEKNLILLLKTMSEDATLEDSWRELTEYNLGIVLDTVGDEEGSEEIYRRLVSRVKNIELANHADTANSDLWLGHQTKTKEKKPLVPLKVAAVATEQRTELKNLQTSLEMSTSPATTTLDVLGMGEAYYGNAQKVALFRAYLNDLHDDQLVLLVDAYDVLITGNLTDLVTLYQTGGLTDGKFKEIVFSAETTSYPDKGIGRLYANIGDDAGVGGVENSLFKFLNSGSFIGTTRALKKMLDAISTYKSLFVSDQRAFTRFFLANEDVVGLDRRGVGFFTLHGISEDCVIDGKTNKLTNSGQTPLVVHGNAGGEGGKQFYRELVSGLFEAINAKRTVVVKAPLFSSAVAEYHRGNLVNAKNLLIANLEKNPTHLDSIYNLGVIYGELGEEENAVALYTRCISIDDYVNCFLNLATLLSKRGAFTDAKKLLLRAEGLEDAKGHTLLALASKQIDSILKSNEL